MLSTACSPLDDLLDGGLEEDAITLVFGEGGSGKTNLALQCARQVVAAGGKVAYIDTEGVSGRRMEQVFEVAFPDPEERAMAEERVLFFSPFTIAEQEKMVERTSLLQGIGLVVVDSINMHYRLHIDDDKEARKEKEASRSLFKQLHHLTGYARQQQVPVLVTGQVYGGEDATQPFARRVMEHLVKALVRFEKRPDGSRRATVLKHRSIEEGRQARFRIGPHGLEGGRTENQAQSRGERLADRSGGAHARTDRGDGRSETGSESRTDRGDGRSGGMGFQHHAGRDGETDAGSQSGAGSSDGRSDADSQSGAGSSDGRTDAASAGRAERSDQRTGGLGESPTASRAGRRDGRAADTGDSGIEGGRSDRTEDVPKRASGDGG